jgi:hypothetical protein
MPENDNHVVTRITYAFVNKVLKNAQWLLVRRDTMQNLTLNDFLYHDLNMELLIKEQSSRNFYLTLYIM